MGRAHRPQHWPQDRLGTEHFQAPLLDFFTSPLLADRRIAALAAEKSPRPLQAKTALAILADVPCPGREHGVGNLLQVGIGNEDDYLGLSRSVLIPQRLDLDQVQTAGQKVVDAAN